MLEDKKKIQSMLDKLDMLGINQVTILGNKYFQGHLDIDGDIHMTFHKGESAPFIADSLATGPFEYATTGPVYGDWYMTINVESV